MVGIAAEKGSSVGLLGYRTRVRQSVSWLAVFGMLTLVLLPSSASAYELVEGYYNPSSSSQIIAGMYVSKVNDTGLVAPTKPTNADKALGVASQEESGVLTLSKKDSNVFVATSGTLPVFITDLSGSVNDGDYLSASEIPGVLKKATDADDYVLGVARGKLDTSDTAKARVLEFTKSNGAKTNISLGLVTIDIRRFANPGKAAKNPFQRIGEGLVRKPVAMIQIALAGAFFLIAIISIFVIAGTATRSSITSIGRNPLARKSILKGLYQIIALSVLILIVGLAGTYLILWI